MYTVHQTRKYICENDVENYNPIFDMLHEYNRYRQKLFNGKRTAEYQPAAPV